MIKAEEIRAMTVEEIDDKVNSCKKELYSLRVQAKTGKLEKQNRIGTLKRDIARLLTIQQELVKEDNLKKKK